MAIGVDARGQLGVRGSSARFKEAIKPMDKASEAIFSLAPVTFRYKKALDPAAQPQFGLVAEQVAKVDPDLVVSDEKGKPFSVRYEEVNAMLLNEFLKEHRKVEEQTEINQRQEATIARQEKDFHAAIAQQEKEIQALTAALKTRAAQIQKVSDEQRAQASAPRVVANN
jgi:predicted ribosome quality control (RQC) complex YloA/Tae2 family protein